MGASRAQQQDRRERRKLAIAIAVLVVAIGWLAVYFGAFDPLLRSRRSAVLNGPPDQVKAQADQIIQEQNAPSEGAHIPKGSS